MSKKGFEANMISEETPKSSQSAEKPLNKLKIETKRVDINVLKARAKAVEDKENIKNKIIFFFFVMVFGAAGIYFSI